MNYGKIIFLIGSTVILSACSVVGQNTAVKQSSSAKGNSQNVQYHAVEQTATDTTGPMPPESTAAALPSEPIQISQPDATPTVAVTAPSATPPRESVHIDARSGLVLPMGYQQAWNQTAKALSQVGYPVMEQDNASGTYYILDKIGTGGVIKRDTPIYQLHLQKTGSDKTVATLSNAQNQPADDGVAQRILGALKSKLGA